MSESEKERGGLSANWAVREVDHLFTRFARYTRFVVYSKWSLGMLASVLLVTLVLYPILSKDKSGMRVSFVGTSGLTEGEKGSAPSMANPIFQGVDAKGQKYKITGTKATQASGDVIVIDRVEGQLLTGQDSFIQLSAARGEYRKAQHRLDLSGTITMMHGNGYTFVTERASVDTNTMEVTGNEPVSGEGPAGNLLATGFKIRDNGTRVNFGGTGRVNVVIDKGNKS